MCSTHERDKIFDDDTDYDEEENEDLGWASN